MMMTSDIRQEYANMRVQALSECEERTRAAYAAMPRLEAIARQRRELAFGLGRSLLGDVPDKAALRRQVASELAALDAEQARLLEDAGVGADYLKPRFHCPLCEDTGYVGQVQKAPCICLRQRLLRQSFASSIGSDETFESFRADVYPTDTQRKLSSKARSLCESYANDFPDNERRDLLIMGPTGLGKTFLLNAIAERVAQRGHTVTRLTAYNLVSAYRQSIFDNAAPVDCLSPELLIIDDLGSEPMIKNITCEYLFSVINERQNAGLSTAIGTNLSPEEMLESYSERLFSRVMLARSCTVIPLEGKDLRAYIK